MKRLIGLAVLGMCLVLSSSDMSEAQAGSLAKVLCIQDLIDANNGSVVYGGGQGGTNLGSCNVCPSPKSSGGGWPVYNLGGAGVSVNINVTIVIVQISATFGSSQASAFCCCIGF